MELKIGEIFECNGEWYQCLKSNDTCGGCAGKFQPYSFCNNFSECIGRIFKELKKIEEPYEYFIQGRGIIMVQEYILVNPSYIWDDKKEVFVRDCHNGRVAIEIKQNKEDMIRKVKMSHEDRDYLLDRLSEILHDNHCREKEDEICDSLIKYIEEERSDNMKPFDLEAAKAGKSVYTRDGKKVRIICFDKKGAQPIVALIEEEDNTEGVGWYYSDGKYLSPSNGKDSKYDLMMLSEKKEGWVNIYKHFIYKTKEEAQSNINPDNELINTIKIEWKE